MATLNPFDLLDDDAEDAAQLPTAAQLQKPVKAETVKPVKPAKLPSKPVPPAQAVRDTKGAEGLSRGGGRGFGRGRGGGGYNREPRYNDAGGNENGYGGGNRPSEGGDAVKPFERRGGGYGGPRGSFRGARRGGFNNGDSGEGERPRRVFDRRSGTGRGNEFVKREGSGRGNWGTPADDIAPETEEPALENEKNAAVDKPEGEEEPADANKVAPAEEAEEKEPEDKEMTLEEYEKILEEKRRALAAPKTEERKVDTKEFESMQQLSSKKTNDEIFAKLGSEKEKSKNAADKEEKAKKSLSINEFLKPAEGEYYPRGGRGRGGRGRGRGGGGGGYGYSGNARSSSAPSIEDAAQFPSLGGK